ncbi:MAM and LDL-receptor class A domain-containing protein 1 [Portunus trituberculatus]|uniref:MAM and LDL-receptor class A domain-containing protein 1 n=1 Tax=Portunus trituberculatus TaxID=210409 RepID=A0A5B7I360_PORTR|nr:MAM and LDL-receptor class A domain-containing protein 1 [Portunus trituberculatus]
MNEVSCDFNNGDLCQWSSGSSDVIEWLLESDVHNTHGVGPLADHTTGDGYFISLTPTHDRNEGVAVIVTPELTATSAQDFCLRWWYHMDGSDVESLSVHLITLKEGKETVVWTKKGFQTSWWTEAFVGIHINEAFVLEFRGSQGKNLLSNLALDDIDMKPAVCPGEDCLYFMLSSSCGPFL